MTNEEALSLIKSTDYCFVVWSTEQNSVIAVKSVRRDAPPDELVATMLKMAGPDTTGRFLDPSTTTLATLEEEQREIDRMSSRQLIFRMWQACSTEELVRLLEQGEFPPPMDSFHGPRHIIEQLYYAADRVVSQEQLERIDAVAVCRRGRFENPLWTETQCCIAVLSRDRRRLERLWSPRGTWEAFRVAVGDLQLDSRHIVDDLIATVRRQFLFSPRFDAMMALGKIGSTAGEDAASAIETHIYESSEEVATLRRLAMQRIRTPASDWRLCTDCVRGMVPDYTGAIPSFKSCTTCRGLSWITTRVHSTTES